MYSQGGGTVIFPNAIVQQYVKWPVKKWNGTIFLLGMCEMLGVRDGAVCSLPTQAILPIACELKNRMKQSATGLAGR